MALDEPQDNDEIETVNGIQVAIDPKVVNLTSEVTLEKRSRGFVLTGIPSNDEC